MHCEWKRRKQDGRNRSTCGNAIVRDPSTSLRSAQDDGVARAPERLHVCLNGPGIFSADILKQDYQD
jgi:hypothetical protein